MSYTVAFNAAALIKGLNTQLEAAIAAAVQDTAKTTALAWAESIQHTPGIWQPYRDRYAASIKVEYDQSGMGARIYSDDPMATPIERGMPARDMKRMLDTSLKTRVAQTGKHAGQRYMIIPFRHNTPGNNALAGDMPAAVYAQAKELTKSSVTAIGMRQNQLGVHDTKSKSLIGVRSRNYQWGQRLKGADIDKRFKGMVRFQTSSGGQNSSSYMTFRVMGEWSTGWVIGAKPGRYIVRDVAAQAQIMFKDEVSKAIANVTGS